MKKNYFILAAIASIGLASCSNEEYVGDENLLNENKTGAILFSSSTPNFTRAEGAAAAEELGYSFKVYGVKKVGDNYSNVFATNQYSNEATYNALPYTVWYGATTAGSTNSNSNGWEYVGTNNTQYGTSGHEVTLTADQTIKYWDYSADQYEFVGYSATVAGGENFITKFNTNGFTVNGNAAQLAGLYIANKEIVNNKNANPTRPANGYNKIGDCVRLTFRNAAAKVRLGIYETIHGYVVKNVKFRPISTGPSEEFTETTSEAKLSGTFKVSESTGTAEYTVTYAADGTPQVATTAGTAKYFNFGTFTSNSEAGIGITSTAPTWAGSTTQPFYSYVLPQTTGVGNMILYVDYDLYNDVSKETIHVYGAKAVVPSIYMTWNSNYAYTYLFKISDNTNGQTSTADGTPAGIFPITFDAVTITTVEGSDQGTTTTVTTPSITTYQERSVVDVEDNTQNPAVSKHGITYADDNSKDIYVTVNIDETLADLVTAEGETQNLKLFTVAAGTTEADLMLHAPTTGAATINSLAANTTVGGITFVAGKTAYFTPTEGTYALQYKYLAKAEVAEHYDEVTTLSNGDDLSGYYEYDNGNYTVTLDGTFDSNANKKYYTYTAAIPAVYQFQYKIIIVE